MDIFPTTSPTIGVDQAKFRSQRMEVFKKRDGLKSHLNTFWPCGHIDIDTSEYYVSPKAKKMYVLSDAGAIGVATRRAFTSTERKTFYLFPNQ